MRPLRRAGAAGPATVVLATLLLAAPTITWPANTLDEMILLVYPERMAAGDRLYEDFFTAYGPTHWYGLRALQWFVGPDLLATRLLGLLVHIALVLAVYRLALPWGRALATLCGLIGAVLLFRLGVAPYAWVSAAALCLWQVSLLGAAVVTRRQALVAGVLAGLVVGIRPDAALLALVPALPLLRGTGHVRSWAAGVLVGAVPVLVTLITSPAGFLDNVLLGRAGKGAGQSRLPLIPADGADRVMVAVLLLAVLLGALAALLHRSALGTSWALLALLSLPQAFQRADRTHYVYAGLLFLPLLPVVVRQLLEALPVPVRRATLLGPLLGGALFLAGTATPVVQPILITMAGDGPEAREVRRADRTLLETPERAAALRRLLPFLDGVSRPGDTLFVFDRDLVRPMITDVGLYHLFPDLSQTAYNLEITPGLSSARGSRLDEDLHNADLLVLVTATPEFREALFPYAQDGARDAAKILGREFCQVDVVAFYEVFRRCTPR